MENNLYGVIIKVENIDICRSFYRDILDLGPPVLDSNFWVEFKLPCGTSIVLEKVNENETPAVGRGCISWLYSIDNIDTIIERLEKYGYESISHEEDVRIGLNLHVFCDPEGNPFYLCSKSENEA